MTWCQTFCLLFTQSINEWLFNSDERGKKYFKRKSHSQRGFKVFFCLASQLFSPVSVREGGYVRPSPWQASRKTPGLPWLTAPKTMRSVVSGRHWAQGKLWINSNAISDGNWMLNLNTEYPLMNCIRAFFFSPLQSSQVFFSLADAAKSL